MPVRSVIEAALLTYAREGDLIIDRFDFKIPQGQFVGVLGPNGGGKTTLIRLILGLLPSTSGTIRVFGGKPTDRAVRRRIAYVPQRGGNIDSQFPATVEEVVRSGLVGRGRIRQEDIEAALKTTDIAHLRNRTLGRLSGGERQRVLIARALASKPELLVLDEPTDGLDRENQANLFRILKRFRKESRMTILFVSHDVHMIAREANSAMCLHHELVCHGHHVCMIKKNEIHNAFHAGHKELVEHHAEIHDDV